MLSLPPFAYHPPKVVGLVIVVRLATVTLLVVACDNAAILSMALNCSPLLSPGVVVVRDFVWGPSVIAPRCSPDNGGVVC